MNPKDSSQLGIKFWTEGVYSEVSGTHKNQYQTSHEHAVGHYDLSRGEREMPIWQLVRVCTEKGFVQRVNPCPLSPPYSHTEFNGLQGWIWGREYPLRAGEETGEDQPILLAQLQLLCRVHHKCCTRKAAAPQIL